MKNTKIRSLFLTLIVTLVSIGIFGGFVISQFPKNSKRNPDFIAGLHDFSVVWIGSSHISNFLIDSLDRKLAASGTNELVILDQPADTVPGDVIFMDGHWFGSSTGDMSFIRNFVDSHKLVIIVGGDRAAVSAIILDQLQDLLSESSIENLYYYSDPLPNEEVVAAVAIWPGKEVTTMHLLMRGLAETDKEALDSLIHSMLQQIADNWRR